MTPPTSPRPLASGLVALVATGALLLSATPAHAQSGLSTASSSFSAAASVSVPDGLGPGEELLAGRFIASSESGGGYSFRMQDDGNAVVYDEVGHAVFDTGTSGRGNRLVMQTDGNVVIYAADDRPLWSTGTDNETDAYLTIQADGNLVVYRGDDTAAWASSVNRRIPEPPFSTLSEDEALSRGHQLTSPNGLFRAVMQRDGNLVGYGPDGVVWNTGTTGADNRLLIDDGEAVIVAADDTTTWSAGNEDDAGSIALDDSGVLSVLDDDDAVLWTSQSGLPGAQMYAPNTLEIDDLLRSDDGRYRAVMQADGNLVVYSPTGAIWQTGTSGVESSFEFSEDGTAQVVAGNGAVTWRAAPAGGDAPFRLVMQSDGNLVEYDAHHRAVWSSR